MAMSGNLAVDERKEPIQTHRKRTYIFSYPGAYPSCSFSTAPHCCPSWPKEEGDVEVARLLRTSLRSWSWIWLIAGAQRWWDRRDTEGQTELCVYWPRWKDDGVIKRLMGKRSVDPAKKVTRTMMMELQVKSKKTPQRPRRSLFESCKVLVDLL
ncbi:hypothetical protein ASPWEDRAFT_501996 [Aspergillus wentii DTO 134E9]|uniref:Uncharacterized protein n=1 Tax=Aspergillus wentii DTO 134E9 TaxID=1073089 RepID=A0A1L9RJX9_ASPWE|nr:uncharacterized protein ASPWEDRAFT_501996 [Aspergillus wentii DTO 134E9]OJJ35246.1 hypothetical protein ASPWEDRAFT_501996 [Aspergillus wentii DTO 134E9]